MTNESKNANRSFTAADARLKELQIQQAELNLAKARRSEPHEIIYQAAELRRVNAAADSAELDLAKKRRESARELASPEENLTYTFYDEVSEDSVKNCLAELSSWSRRFPAKPIILILNSPGGEVIAGLALFDYILKLRSDGHHVTVIVLGMAASMGGILLQAGDTRVMGKYSQLLIHEVSAGTSGILPAMEDSVAFFKSLWMQLSEILAERSLLGVAQIRARALRKDWWLTSSEAVALGFADEVLPAPAPVKKVINSKSIKRKSKKAPKI